MLLLALAACGGGGSGAVLPTGTTSAVSPIGTTGAPTGPTGTTVTPTGTGTATATTSSTPAFSVTGQVSSVYTGGFLIQAGSGCGYLKVVTNSATQTNLNGQTLKSGVYAQVMGSGTCSTQITATTVSLAASANGPFPGPAPAPGTPSTTATSSTPSFSVTGQVSSVYTGGFLIQAGPGCGYLKVVTSSATQTNLNGQTLKAGVYAEAWGTGSCATQITATTVSLAATANGPFPAPAGVPGTSPAAPAAAAAPAPLTVSAGGSGAYASIVNGQPWPTSFRPYSQYPWNATLPTSPANVDTTNTSRLAAYGGSGPNNWSERSDANDFGHPVYFAKSTDPSIAINCSSYLYHCNVAFPATINIPAAARPASGSDHHMGVIEPDGTEYDFWYASYNGSSLTSGGAAMSSITGTGVPANDSATSGASLAAGIIRFSEVSTGVIPHALFVVVPCVSGSPVYPGTTTGTTCSDGQGIPMGAHIHLKLSDSQIDALSYSSDVKTILHALHQYGAYVEDTGGGNGPVESTMGPSVMYEDPTQYTAFGATFPGVAWGAGHASCNGSQCSGTPIPFAAIGWSNFEVLDKCYGQGTCSN